MLFRNVFLVSPCPITLFDSLPIKTPEAVTTSHNRNSGRH